MYDIWWMIVPVVTVLAIIYGIVRYRLHTGRLVLEEEEKLLVGQFELLKKEQSEINAFRAQMAEELDLWRKTRQACSEQQAYSEQIELFQDEVLTDLLSDMEERETHCYWQDTLLNMTFLHKLDECRRCGIKMTLEGFPQEGMPAPNAGHTELTSLMINLFDNAREACQLIPDIEDRWITIDVQKKKGRLFICMKNSCNDRSRQRFGSSTWKKNAEKHGIGMDIITDLVNSMNGRIKNERRENVYQVELMLPVDKVRSN